MDPYYDDYCDQYGDDDDEDGNMYQITNMLKSMIVKDMMKIINSVVFDNTIHISLVWKL